jgi:hypothetical protein
MRSRIGEGLEWIFGGAALTLIIWTGLSGCSREPEYAPLEGETEFSSEMDHPQVETPPAPDTVQRSDDPAEEPIQGVVDEKEVMAALGDFGIRLPPDGKRLPENFPKDVPVPEGGTVELYVSDPLNVLFKVPDPFPTAVGRYRSALEGEGWVFEKRRDGKGQMTTLSFRKGERSLETEIAADSVGTSVSLNLDAAQSPSPGLD